MDPGQDLLLAALSESGICPNDIGLFDVDSQDVAQPSTTQQVRRSSVLCCCGVEEMYLYFFNLMFWFPVVLQSISISALDVGVGTETVEAVRTEPPAPVPIVTIRVRVQNMMFPLLIIYNILLLYVSADVLWFELKSKLDSLSPQQHKPQPSTTTFVLNQLNQLPSLGAVVTKQSVTNPIKHTITVTKVVHVANSALRGSSTPSTTTVPPSASTVVPSNRDQVRLWRPCFPRQSIAAIDNPRVYDCTLLFSQQIQLKDLLRTGPVKTTGLKGNSLMELMKLKPPPNIAPPVATATATGPSKLFKFAIRSE